MYFRFLDTRMGNFESDIIFNRFVVDIQKHREICSADGIEFQTNLTLIIISANGVELCGFG